MISDINKETIQNQIKRNVFFLLFSKPNIYLKVLVFRTLGMGIFTFIILFSIRYFKFDSYTIPSAMNSLIGIVIGLLLVFRTNTAYDRWWDGRKIIASLSSEVSIITARVNTLKATPYLMELTHTFKFKLKDFLLILRNYLTVGEDNEQSDSFHLKQKESLESLFKTLSYMDIDDSSRNLLINSLVKMMEHSNQLERIKNTPIPLSYVFHIKVSVLIYLLMLPFGMFHDLGFWCIPFIMLIYYIIAGVEIISSEIENPFANDPNDLPTFKLFKTMFETLKT